MRWSTVIDDDGNQRAGVWSEQGLHLAPAGVSLLALIAEGRLEAAAAEATAAPPHAVGAVLPPIPQPPSIRDFMAFEDHVAAGFAAIGMELHPLWYSLPGFYFTNPAALHGATEPVAIPPGSCALDYELEVAAVIGREGRDLGPREALDPGTSRSATARTTARSRSSSIVAARARSSA
jgi:2-keto-4-pentenoate hydratase/2-oxohepta-3-ene-1,7-dioic acid hydratase in catechol pathway